MLGAFPFVAVAVLAGCTCLLGNCSEGSISEPDSSIGDSDAGAQAETDAAPVSDSFPSDPGCDAASGQCGCADADQDGVPDLACGGTDCDDGDASIHPGAAEICGDGIDQDCQGGDLACPACSEGAVVSSGCLCAGIKRTTGYCCSDNWQAGACGTPPNILWRDDIQAGDEPWGFDGIGVEHPIDTEVTPDDANGANLSKAADPLGGGGFAMRHFATFDEGGSRSQAGIYSMVNSVFGDQAKRPEGVWVAQEWYFPEALDAGDDPACWINLWDWHSTNPGGGNRWHTAPGLILARDGSMRVRWEWGGGAGDVNSTSGYSTIPLPVGEWFDIEMHYVWTTGTTTLSLWINGQLALEQTGVQTRVASHENVETYLKFYGSTQGGTPWSPTPSLKYTRNVRVAGERIWR